MLIALAGYATCGKSTAAELFVSKKMHRWSFAFPIRELIYRIYDLDWCRFEDKDYENGLTLSGNIKFRDMMRAIAEAGRSADPYIWIRACHREIASRPKVVLSDLRFCLEAEYVRKRGGYIILVERDIDKRDPLYSHSSESEIELLRKMDLGDRLIRVDNNGSIEDLNNRLEDIYNDISGRFDSLKEAALWSQQSL